MNKKLTKLFAASAAALTLGAVVAPVALAEEAKAPAPVERVEGERYRTPNGVAFGKLTRAKAQEYFTELLNKYKTEQAKTKGLEGAVSDAEKALTEAKEGHKTAVETLEAAKKELAEAQKAEEAANKEWAEAQKALKEAQNGYTQKAKAIKDAAEAERQAAEKAGLERIAKAEAAVAAATAELTEAQRLEKIASDAYEAYKRPDGQVEADETELGLLGELNAASAAVGAAETKLNDANNAKAAEQTNAHADYIKVVENINARETKALDDLNYEFKDKEGYKVQPDEQKLLEAEKVAAKKASDAKLARTTAEPKVPAAVAAVQTAEADVKVKEAKLLRAQKELSNHYVLTTGLLADVTELAAQQGLNYANSGVALSKDQLADLEKAKKEGSDAIAKRQEGLQKAADELAKAEEAAIKANPELEKVLTSKDATGKKEDKKDAPKAEKKSEAKPAAKSAAKPAAKSEGKELPKTGEETAMVVIGAGLVATIAGGALVVSNRKKA